MLGLITIQRREETLSQAFIHSIATIAGLNVEYRSAGNDCGVDGSLRRLKKFKNRLNETGLPLDFQLKATINWDIEEHNVIYDLEAKTYNDFVLRNHDGDPPKILILLCLPSDSSEWLSVDKDRLLLKKCCYWYRILNTELTENQSTIRIRIPVDNIITPESLLSLFETIG